MNQNSTIYNRRMKMADLVASDISLLSILQRLNIALGFGEATVAEVCAQHNISVDLFLMICNIYSFRDYRPQIETLTNDDIRNITAYLRASHKFYSTICIFIFNMKIIKFYAFCRRNNKTCKIYNALS